MNKLIIATFALFINCIQAQSPFSYKDYWKNRKPDAAYWQQDVHYKIKAEIIDTLKFINAELQLNYYNNSPDTLKEVYFHLYQNAFQPNSYAHAINTVNHEETTFGKNEGLKNGTRVSSLKHNNNELTFTVDNTIMIVKLKNPILPGGKATFDIQFKTWWDNGSMRRRFKTFTTEKGVQHFDGVHWYPRICVYDRKFGWETDQHLGKEFYGDFGVYDVELTFPSEYVVEATGNLTNESEVLPGDLKNALDINNYSTLAMNKMGKPYYAPTNYKFKTSKGFKKTWKYYAENVHDFAFTADPSYRFNVAEWNGIKCIALAQEKNAHAWRPTSNFVASVVKIYSTDIGMYGYPKIVAADAQDGMEYPMITLNGGNWPGHQYVIAHEVGHNWFFGMIGNNETYRAMLDEGFTQFLTSWSIKKFNGISMHANAYDEGTVYNGYLNDAINKNDVALNTHSDDFNSATGHGGGYRHVYFKTATMLYNLQYVLGDELFLNAMKHYFNKWKFAHPYPEDFRQAIIEYTHVDLNWFFDQWMETTKQIDYKICSIKRVNKKEKGNYQYQIKFKRKGDMQMPLDIEVIDVKNKNYSYVIPNTYFVKNDQKQALKTWKGWGLLNKTYVDTITLNNKIKRLEIDTTNRLADVYRMDNIKTRSQYKLPINFKFDNGVAMPSSFNSQNYSIRPDVWFNAVDGLKLGIYSHSDYVKQKHVLDVHFWYNSGIGSESGKYKYGKERDLFSYKLVYSNLVGKYAYIYWDTRYLDGIFYDNLGFKKTFGKNFIDIHYKSISLYKNKRIYWLDTLNQYRDDKTNASLMVDYRRDFRYMKGSGNFKAGLRGNGITKDYSYGSIYLELNNQLNWKKFEIKTRLFMQHIEGSEIAPEVLLNLSGANLEQMLESKFTRSRGWVPQEWLGYGSSINHFQQGGGLNLRGYAGYLAPETAGGNIYTLYSGTTGMAANIEIDFDKYFPFRPKYLRDFLHLDLYVFGDAGILGDNQITVPSTSNPLFGKLRADAGIGSMLSIKRWGKRNLIQPLGLRFDVPFILNRPPFTDKGYVANRWVVGIGRCF